MPQKQSILEKYESYEAVPAAVKAWITIRAEKAGKSVKMSHAGYKAAFKRIQRRTYVTIIFENGGYLGGGVYAEPIHHIIKARNEKMLFAKVEAIFDALLAEADTECNTDNADVIENKEEYIRSLIEDGEEVTIDGSKLKIVSDPDWVFIH